jgi:hypothetical protein
LPRTSELTAEFVLLSLIMISLCATRGLRELMAVDAENHRLGKPTRLCRKGGGRRRLPDISKKLSGAAVFCWAGPIAADLSLPPRARPVKTENGANRSAWPRNNAIPRMVNAVN